ncbi:hypothetical protein J2T13_004940 [Paenibacillus sp. DS2015]|uniref:hypothetical protein n=1 Tax=Paenibacillus sp. DS2015 TaxID=3373917 RepID=UPI003D1DC98C
MVKFTIEVTELILPTHRLQKDDTFRELGRGPFLIEATDKVFNDYSQAEKWRKDRPIVEVGDTRIDNIGARSLADPYLHIRQHRTAKPIKSYFTKDEVATVLRKGNDETHNFLVVDYNGDVHLIPRGNNREGYAVRFESFQAGNGYVGQNSGLNHLNNTYLAMMEGWLVHLHTGDGVYRDYSDGQKTVDELQQEAELIVSQMNF